jgi:hypothetical protein
LYEGGRVISRQQISAYIAGDSESSIHTFNTQAFPRTRPGYWSIGSYRLDVYINDQKVSSGNFEVFSQ